MVNSKKLLSLFLAVVMILSVFTVMASAYTMGPEVAGNINYKYTVEKVDTVPETEAGSAEYSADNIYAVSVWMQSNDPVMKIIVPFHFDKTLFSPIMLFDGEVTYPYGAGFGVDDYYDNMGEGAVYAYSEGDYLLNTGMYKADGSKATTKALAKCIGLGSSNSSGRDVTVELVSPSHPLYNRWGAGLPENVGVMYASVDVTGKSKTAYLNTIDGITQDTGWNKMFTFYFETITDADVTGTEFGVYTPDCFTVDGVTDISGYGYFAGATVAKVGNPTKNVVENAVVEVGAEFVPLTVSNWKDQIRFDKYVTGAYSGTFDYRMLATIDNFDEVIGTDYDKVTDVGFIFNKGAAIDEATAKAQVEGGAKTYSQVSNVYVSTAYQGKTYVISCLVNNIADADKTTSLSSMAYVEYVVDGETYYAYSAVATSTFEGLYNQYYSQAFGA